MNSDAQLAASLYGIRRRRRQALLAVPLWFFGFVLLAGAADAIRADLAELLVNAEGFGGFVLINLLWLRVLASRCPRCRRRFFTKSHMSNVFASRCVHCGLALPRPGSR